MPQSPGLAGVSIDRTGKFTFDRTKFLDRVQRQPRRCRAAVRAGRQHAATERAVRLGGQPRRRRLVRRQRHATRGAGERHRASPARGRRRALPTVKVRVGTTEMSYTVGRRRLPRRRRRRAEQRVRERRPRTAGDRHGLGRADRDHRVRAFERRVRRRLGRHRLRRAGRHRRRRDHRRRRRDRKRPAAASCRSATQQISGLAHQDHRQDARRPRQLHLPAGHRATRPDLSEPTRPTSSRATSPRRRTTSSRASSTSTTRWRRWSSA